MFSATFFRDGEIYSLLEFCFRMRELEAHGGRFGNLEREEGEMEGTMKRLS